MQKKLIFLLLCLTLYSPVSAASPSASATPSDEITQNLKKRLQDSLANQFPSNSSTYRSYVGVIKDVIKDNLIIEDKDGKKNIKIASGSAIVRSPGNTNIELENIRIDDYVIAIGQFLNEDEMESLRLVVSTAPLTSTTKISGLGIIKQLNKSSLTLTSYEGEQTQTLHFNTKTIIKSVLGTALAHEDLAIGDSIIYTASLDKDLATSTIIMRVGSATQ